MSDILRLYRGQLDSAELSDRSQGSVSGQVADIRTRVSFSQCHHPRHPWRLLYLCDSRIAGQGGPVDLPRRFLLSSQKGDGWIGMVVTTSPAPSGQQNMQQRNFYDRHLFFRERPVSLLLGLKLSPLFHLHLA